jgi:hypothetical protein
MEYLVAMESSQSVISRCLTVLVGAVAVFLLSVSLLHGPGHCLKHSDESHEPEHECAICALLYYSSCILTPDIEIPVSFEIREILQFQHSHQNSHFAVPQFHIRAPPAFIPA